MEREFQREKKTQQKSNGQHEKNNNNVELNAQASNIELERAES